ncbi:cell division protein ZapA [Vibrio sp.]|uniref:Cell division protein ZapA n=1 Tax=Vibrio viridaestus TaxID=2487322 RepID=A0A3N9TI59_9VIBR|nr:cell division protein ZapA [Vibrio viridaestus]MDC0610632.1 cell division protein ZapA [Vibrio sp.]RQW63760.1 cell division protein ZapA [Vibrio viridaestus]
MSNQAVEVKILGNTTRVNCPKGQEESLIAAAHELNSRLHEMSERTKVNNETKLLTIAALNICYELQQFRQESEHSEHRLLERIEQLSVSLEHALNKVTKSQQQ